jgi:polysaccharide biosynthesis/export protein
MSISLKLAVPMLAAAAALSACASNSGLPSLPPAQFQTADEGPGADYVVGPLDALSIFVWRNPELSTSVTVRPDGRFTTPLIEDMVATGKTPSQLADEIEKKLTTYIQDPIVSVIVNNFNGPLSQQVRVVGEAARPSAIPYRSNMTLLDVMIAVGGLTEYAAGNGARLVRFDKESGTQREYGLRIESLLKSGDTKANVAVQPGDVIIIPESFF